MKLRNVLKYTLFMGIALLSLFFKVSAADTDFDLGRNSQILFNMFRDLNIMYVDSVDSDKMVKDAAKGMVSELDPYTELIPESGMEEFEMLTTGKYGGMGALIRQSGDYVVISQPYKGFPADKAGLVIGDKILEINGVDVKGYDVTKISDMLKGEPGTSIRLKVEKLLTGKTEDLTFKRERIVISGVSYYGMLSDSIGYIVHSNFTENCSSDIRKAFLELKKQGMTSLILDLRGNGGGILQEAVKILSMFVPKGTVVVSIKGRTKESEAVYKTESEPIDTNIPVAILVDRGSASAAEIVSGAFQDLDRGVLIGNRTFGKGLVQSTRPLGYNAYLKLTTAKYYIPSGRCIQAVDYTHRNEDGSVGLIPDSLIKEFVTAGGRKVYDGGGVMPDIKNAPENTASGFTIALYTKGYIEEFANQYFKEHQNSPVDVDTFHITDDDYAAFVEFMADKDVDFESATQKALEELQKKATQDKYIDRIGDALKEIESKIKDDKNADLALYREDISKLLEDEIVMRFHYGEGVLRHNANYDEDIRIAKEVLSNPQRYKEILTSQDTARK